MARTNTPLSFATHSEFRLGLAGDPRVTLLRMRKAGVLISLSFDATSIAPPNMFETMRFTWNMGIPWRGTPSENQSPVGFRDVIAMATINGARALGLGDVTGSLTIGKRADIILIRGNDINVAPVANVETAVVQSATPANVDTVIVNSKIVETPRQARRLRRRGDRRAGEGIVLAHSRGRWRRAGAAPIAISGRRAPFDLHLVSRSK